MPDLLDTLPRDTILLARLCIVQGRFEYRDNILVA